MMPHSIKGLFLLWGSVYLEGDMRRHGIGGYSIMCASFSIGLRQVWRFFEKGQSIISRMKEMMLNFFFVCGLGIRFFFFFFSFPVLVLKNFVGH